MRNFPLARPQMAAKCPKYDTEPLQPASQRRECDSGLNGRGTDADASNGNVDFTINTQFYFAYTKNRVVVTVPCCDSANALPQGADIEAGEYDPSRLMSRAEPAPEKSQKWWRKKLGHFIAKDVLVEELVRGGRAWPRKSIMRGLLQSFPPGYTLMSVPRLKDPDHKDNYLCSAAGQDRWRSPEEFGPHLAWLLTGQRRDVHGQSACECLRCVKVRTGKSPKQGDITSDRYDDIDEYFVTQPKANHTVRAKKAKAGPLYSVTNRPVSQIIATAKDYTKLKHPQQDD